ncbi:MAG: serine hydrolase domain-containing protein [Flavobacteriaceae bacterium]
MNPIFKKIANLFAFQRVVGKDLELKGLVKADALLLDLVNQKKLPGLSITVLREGKTVLQKGYGFADIDNKVSIDPTKTIFRIASVSKNIAATALAYLVEVGKIDLDASFYNYVPYYPKKQWDFSIRQLASHTAGIRGYRGMEYGLNKPYSIKESIEIFKDDPLLFEPGTDYLYTSYDWVLISLAMQEVSGITFQEYVLQNVLAPLEMIHTFTPDINLSPVEVIRNDQGVENNQRASRRFMLREDEMLCLTKYYTKNRLGGFRKAIPVNNCYKLAGGGYLSTSEDIAKFGQAYLEGKMLKDATRNQFLTSQVINEKNTYYGLGWQVSQDQKGRPFYGHIGNGVGGYSNFFVYPEEQMVFAILINCTDPKVQGELDEVIDILTSNNYPNT